TEVSLSTISFINKKLGDKNNNIDLIQNKFKLRNLLKKNFLATPNYLSYKTAYNVNKIGFPLVSKPFYGAGSRGVFLARNNNEFKKLLNENKSFYKNKKILIEKYIPGIEYAVEGWVDDKKEIYIGAISKKKRSKPPKLFDLSLIINYQSPILLKAIKKYLLKLSKILRLLNTVFHLEFKFYKKKIYLIDCSVRGAGYSVYSEILSKIIKQNTDQILIDMFFNKPVKINKPSKEIFFLKFIYLKNLEKLKKKIYKRKVEKLKTFSKIKYYKGINKNSKNKNIRFGHILLSSFDRNLLNKEIKVLNNITI
ncbi:ATP-grasp domain-containing protein, partial [Candidatus Pelagibacter sp.]|uniref:ATP-grasp domain-containing protein n=1 Tax=Candidatus Pelagibacter sp. TaxID=2024849 RepID=UPI003F856D4E